MNKWQIKVKESLQGKVLFVVPLTCSCNNFLICFTIKLFSELFIHKLKIWSAILGKNSLVLVFLFIYDYITYTKKLWGLDLAQN